MQSRVKSGRAVLMVFVLLISIIALPLFFDELPVVERRSTASIMADGLMVIVDCDIIPLTPFSGINEGIVSNATIFWLWVLVPNSNYSVDDAANMTITWQVQTEADVLLKLGRYLNHSYHVEGTYWINVSVVDADQRTGSASVSIIVDKDSDKDGIEDWWEMHYFGNLWTADNTSNYDGDKWTDLDEFILGTDPTVYDHPSVGLLERYWWAFLLGLGVLIVLYLFLLRPKIEAKRREQERKKIAAALELEKMIEQEKNEKE